MAATSGDSDNGRAAPGPLTGSSRWRQVFAGEERQLAVLRLWLSSFLPACPAREDVACVATELGANAVRHTASGQGGWFAVEVTWHRSAVRVAVADSGAPSGPMVISDPDGEHGRGLMLVRGLSFRSGVAGDRRGRLVWADVPWTPDAAALALGGETAGYRHSRLTRWFSGPMAFAGWPARHWPAARWRPAAGPGGTVPAPTARELARLLRQVHGARPRPGAGIQDLPVHGASQRDRTGALETAPVPPARPGEWQW